MLILPDKSISQDSFISLGVWGLAPKASYAIMLQVYYDYYVLTAISTRWALFPIMHLALVFPLGLYLPIHLNILAILICRLVDLSTCRPSVIVNNKDPVDQHLHLHLYTLLVLICRLVDLSTCRLIDLSTY